jgi:allantoinase
MILVRQMDAKSFADLMIDHFEEMLRQSVRQPLVMGIALHAYLMGQPHRLCHLRRALEHIARARNEGRVCITTPGSIASHMDSLGR